MNGIITEGIHTLINNGLIEILVFALIFALVFGILENINLFGNDDEDKNEAKKYNLVIAICFGALSILPHYIARGSRYDIIPIIQKALPQTMILLLAVLGVMILLGLVGFNSDLSDGFGKSWVKPVIALVLLGFVIWIFVGATGVYRLPYWFGKDLIAVALAIGVFALIVYFVMGGKNE
ncbi:MAG: hypothetical protein ACQER9_01900 [Nanobdellota archaeon]